MSLGREDLQMLHGVDLSPLFDPDSKETEEWYGGYGDCERFTSITYLCRICGTRVSTSCNKRHIENHIMQEWVDQRLDDLGV